MRLQTANSVLHAYFRVKEDQADEENISVTRTTSASRSPCSSSRSRSQSRSPHTDGGALNLDTKVTAATTDDEEAPLEKVSAKALESTELRSRLEAFHSSVASEHAAAAAAAAGGIGPHRKCKRYSSTEDIKGRSSAHADREEENGYENGVEAHQHLDLHSRSRKVISKEDMDYYAAAAAAAAAKENPISLVPKSNEAINLFKGSLPLPGIEPVNLQFPLPLARPPAEIAANLYPTPADYMHYLHLLPFPPAFTQFGTYPPPRIYSEEPSSYRKELSKESRAPSPSRTSPAKVIPLYHPSRVDPNRQHQSSAAAVASIH